MFWINGLGFRVSEFQVLGFGFLVLDLRFRF